jgi:hypothetical protein
LEFEKWRSNKNVSANLEDTAIGRVSAPIRLKRTGCAKSATRRGGQQKQIPMVRRDRAVSDYNKYRVGGELASSSPTA